MSRLSQGTDSRQVYGSPGKHNYKLHPHHKPWERLTLSLRLPRQSGFADSPFPAGREKRREESVLERSEREYWTGKEGCTALIPVYTRAFHEMGSSFCRELQVKNQGIHWICPSCAPQPCTGQAMPPCQTFTGMCDLLRAAFRIILHLLSSSAQLELGNKYQQDWTASAGQSDPGGAAHGFGAL